MRKKEKSDLVSREEFIHAFLNLKRGMENLNRNQEYLHANQRNIIVNQDYLRGGAM